MKITLAFSRTEYDYMNAWTNIRTIDVEVPDWVGEDYGDPACKWRLMGSVEKEREHDG